MILSCVARVGQRFGMGHVVDVLRGADTERVRRLGHHELSTWGLMKGRDRKEIMNLAFQLLDQDLLERTGGEYPVLYLNDMSLAVMRGEHPVQLVPVRVKRARTTAREAASWRASIATCSRACGSCAPSWRASATYRPTSSSPTPACATWRAASRRRPNNSSPCTA